MIASPRSTESGFTLIEAMVAMVILSVAAVGIVRASEAHIDTLHGLERRAAAQWVAENALAELSLTGPASVGTTQQAMLGWTWAVTTRAASSEDRDLRQVRVEVRGAGQSAPLVSLRGFVDAGTVTP